jgi:hypothetical protein
VAVAKPKSRPNDLRVIDMKTRQGYRFRKKEKDPVITQVLNLIDESGLNDHQVAIRSDISPQTIKNWRDGVTRRPQNYTLDWVLRTLGYTRAIIKLNK